MEEHVDFIPLNIRSRSLPVQVFQAQCNELGSKARRGETISEKRCDIIEEEEEIVRQKCDECFDRFLLVTQALSLLSQREIEQIHWIESRGGDVHGNMNE